MFQLIVVITFFEIRSYSVDLDLINLAHSAENTAYYFFWAPFCPIFDLVGVFSSLIPAHYVFTEVTGHCDFLAFRHTVYQKRLLLILCKPCCNGAAVTNLKYHVVFPNV